MSGVEEFGLLLFGVEFEDGFEVLFGFDEFMSVLELELLLGVVLDVELLVPVDEFASELLVLEGEVVEDGELDVPLCVEELDGELWL